MAFAYPDYTSPGLSIVTERNRIKSEVAEDMSHLDDIVNDVIRLGMIVNAAFFVRRGTPRPQSSAAGSQVEHIVAPKPSRAVITNLGTSNELIAGVR